MSVATNLSWVVARATVTIRRAQAADLDAIVSIWLEANAGLPGTDVDFEDIRLFFGVRLAASGAESGVWLAEADSGEAVGWAALLPCRNHPFVIERMLECSVFVRPAMQRRWVGKSLIAALLDHVEQSRHIEHVLAFVSGSNTSSLSLFGGFGFSEIAVIEESGKRRFSAPMKLLCYTAGAMSPRDAT